MEINKKPLTKRQSDVLNFIKNCISKESLPPTIQNICHKFGFASTNGVSEILKVLELKGYIKRISKGAGRGIIVIGEIEKQIESHQDEIFKDDNIKYLNIIGKGNAENPLSVFMNSIGQIAIDERHFNASGILFAAKVSDNGMNKYGIAKDDIAIIKQSNLAYIENGLTLALVNDQTIIRELIVNENDFELRASEKGYPKIKFIKNEDGIEILGKVIGLIKSFE